jgi:N-acetylglucosamine PTS system EIICBA or EIICB component
VKPLLETLQQLGRALMLPIAVLPVAAILLRLGQPDIWNALPGHAGAAVAPFLPFVAAAGQAIFANLGLLFAIGVAVGLARENHGAAGLAGAVCFLVLTEGAKTLIVVPSAEIAGLSGKSLDLARAAFRSDALAKLSVPAGILSGITAGWLYNRYSNIKLPDYLAFFGGRRFVPIAAGMLGLVWAALFGFGWPYLSVGMNDLSRAVLAAGPIGLFLYGVLNRLLIVTGLHHIINNLAWFILGDYRGVTGDLKRFFAGDPNAGAFMSGFFPIMMFGLPAACLAMYRAARPERRKAVGGLLLSMALTAFLTGVTEPIEFSFMFLAPALYAMHAVLTGLSMVIMNFLGVKLGFGFSAGLFDYAINFSKSTRPLLLLPVGAAYFAVYYVVFRAAIHYFDLKTLGRESDEVPPALALFPQQGGRGAVFLAALGGAENVTSVDACTTRLRLVLTNGAAVDEAALRSLGARGLVRPAANLIQVVLGPIADQVAGEIRAALHEAPAAVPSEAAAAVTPAKPEMPSASSLDTAALLTALGGAGNVEAVETCSSRLRVKVANGQAVEEGNIRALGTRAVAKPSPGIVHVVIGPDAEGVAVRLRAQIAAG